MDAEKLDSGIEEFFIEDDKKFKEEDLLRTINSLKKYAKLLGREGKVHIERKNLSKADKLKIFLVVRFLGSELAALKPELKINPQIKVADIDSISTFLGVSRENARSRMSSLVNEDFAKRTSIGNIEVKSFQINRFIEYLEELDMPKQKSKKQIKNKPLVKKISEGPKINVEEIYSRLENYLKIDKTKIKKFIYIGESGSFKFDAIFEGSKYAKQKICSLLSAYILFFGFGRKTFQSREINVICKNSYVDVTDLRDAIKQLKKQGLIAKENKGSQSNYLKEKGKNKAEKLLTDLILKKLGNKENDIEK